MGQIVEYKTLEDLEEVQIRSTTHTRQRPSFPIRNFSSLPKIYLEYFSIQNITATMQLQALLFPITVLVAVVAATPYPGYGFGDVVAGPNIAARGADMMAEFEKRKSCSGNRKPHEVCGGKKLAEMNSFHNWYVSRSFSP